MSKYSYFSFWFVVGVSLVLFVMYITLTATPPKLPQFQFGDKIGHLLGYAVLTGWFTQLYQQKQIQFSIFAVFCVMGIGLEFAQGYGGVRMFEYADMVANTMGALLGWLLSRTWFSGTLLKVDQYLSSKF